MLLHNDEWFDENERYVPLNKRDIKETDTFGRIFSNMDGVVEYEQVGGTLFVYTDRQSQDVVEELEQRHGGINVQITRQSYPHTYRWIDTDCVLRVKFTAAKYLP
jgi:hypothetical protein